MSDREEILAALRLSRSKGVGAAAFRRLVLAFGSAVEAEKQLKAPRAEKAPRRKSATEAGIEEAGPFLDAGGRVLVFGQPGYPAALTALTEPPPVLFLLGNLEILQKPFVAIVGARDCSSAGIERAREAAQMAVLEGFAVVSGGARGIDGVAHAACLDCEGSTVAVLGNGVDIAYPKQNAALFDEIRETGALVSEFLPKTPPAPSFFPTRNRIIAGLARAVVLIEGKEKSGSLSTARWALKLGRKVACPRLDADDSLGGASRLLESWGGLIYERPEELRVWLSGIPGEG